MHLRWSKMLKNGYFLVGQHFNLCCDKEVAKEDDKDRNNTAMEKDKEVSKTNLNNRIADRDSNDKDRDNTAMLWKRMEKLQKEI